LFAQATSGTFRVEEASISDIQSAIRAGRTTCKQVVQSFLDRAKAYNGACTALLTMDGKPIPQSTGMLRAGAPVQYPTKTVAASTVFPNLDQYKGIPLELGKMITSVSDPSVQLQYGWRVGIPEAGQLNARLDKRRAAIAAFQRFLDIEGDTGDPALRQRAQALLQELRRGLN